MAQRVKKTSVKNRPEAAPAASNDNMLWILGFVLLVFGVFAVCSVVSHFFHWSSDLSALRNDAELSGVEVPFENICSRSGASVAYLVVDRSFGVFGIILPIVITVVGWRIFRKKRLRLNHFALSAALLLVMGALTMGFIGSQFSVSHDIGGLFGHACAADLVLFIGVFGTVLVLLAGWILTGVFINRNFIRTVNNASDKMVSQSERLVSVVRDRVIKSRRDEDSEQTEDESDECDEIDDAEESPFVEERREPESERRPSSPAPAATPAQSYAASASAESGERVMTINERAAMMINTAGASVAEEPRCAEEPTASDAAASDDAVLPEPDDDGFIVIPHGGAVPNDIDVNALLSDDEVREPQETEFDEEGFAVIPRNVTPAAVNAMPDIASAAVEPAYEPAPAEDRDDDRAEAEDGGIVVTVHEREVSRVDESDIAVDDLYDPLRDLESYRKPYASLLEDYKSPHKVSDAEIYDNKCRIEETLKYFGIPIVDIHATVGPTVTLYEIVQAQGVKIAKIQGLEKDIAQSLKALGIRIIAPISGRGTIGIEVPNRDKQVVSMYSAICSEEFQNSKAELPVVIGRTIQNENFTFDLAKMPHLLVAGATGQGKSVGLNAIITSLLYRKHPAQLKFVMIDPKMVEFSVYNKLERHFLAKMESEDEAIVTDPKKAVYVLNSLVEEMGRRLELCKMATARNIVEYNEKFVGRRLNPQKGHRYLPYIVVIVDEFADLIMTAKEVEVPVMRLAQKARAVGIHLIIATQRPDVKIITGGIKANFPARIAFRVMQMIDSRTIIDQPGANQLIGRGDMLFSKDGELTRIQCGLVETREVERLVDFIAKQQGYTEAYPLPDYVPDAGEGGGSSGVSDGESGAPVKYDVLFGEIARAAVTNGMISTSSIQRNYEVGFNRAGRIMLQLERAGIVGPQVGAKPREIKFYDLPSLEAKLQDLGVF
ncbi:DNA translocase FtsK [Alistipes sp. Z76]|nr:DNA translocase FtsK [Alistipes sp. Z76]NCE66883.1 DNA translocase FtsK [Muribaculaceae bacterium M3]